MELYEFFNYKNQVINDILTNEKIIELIDPSVDIKDVHKLVYNHIYPYEYVPETSETAKTYICVEVDITKVSNKTYLYPTIFIWVFSHKSLLRLPSGGIRTDALSSEISKTINGSMEYGLGELSLSSAKKFSPISDYRGRCLIFGAKDFNRFHNPDKKIPSNRRAGI